MNANCLQLKQQFQKVTDSAFYIDRIDIRVLDLSILKRAKGIVKRGLTKKWVTKRKFSQITNGAGSGGQVGEHKTVKGFKLELYRPRRRLLRELARLLVSASYSISWLEVAFDLNTPSHRDALNLLSILADMIVVPRISKSPTFMGIDDERIFLDPPGPFRSVYFSQQDITTQTGEKKKNKMFKMYIPRGDDKVFGSTSLHTEFCLAGTEKVASFGIWTIGDIVRLDPKEWYGRFTEVRGINKERIGSAIHQGAAPVGTRQHQKIFSAHYAGKRALAHKLFHENKAFHDGLPPCTGNWLSAGGGKAELL